MQKWIITLLAGVLGLAMATSAVAAEHSMGKPLVKNGLILHPVYLQAVEMAPMMPGMQKPADVHMELDIHAAKDASHGFAPGSWIPYLTVTYSLQKKDSDWSASGVLTPMVANDGPHYGANIKLDGPGKYVASFTLLPPAYNAFYRHTDKETGVPAWWKPFSHQWTFAYIGVGKKGGY